MAPEPPASPRLAALLRQDAQLVQIVDASLADAAMRSGAHLVCRPGCTPCCHGAFAINALDALRLRTAMSSLAHAQPGLAAAITQRASHYLAEFAPAFPGDPATGILYTSEEAEAAFEDFANEAACPALNPLSGFCDIYEARPMTCRVFGPPVRAAAEDGDEGEGLAVCELCFTAASEEEIAACEMSVPHKEEQLLLKALEEENNGDHDDSVSGETIVAFCLIPQS